MGHPDFSRQSSVFGLQRVVVPRWQKPKMKKIAESHVSQRARKVGHPTSGASIWTGGDARRSILDASSVLRFLNYRDSLFPSPCGDALFCAYALSLVLFAARVGAPN
jgi:hypothetical protein